MNREESGGGEKALDGKSTFNIVCTSHYFQTLDVHVFDNELDINNHETVSYEKDMNNISD